MIKSKRKLKRPALRFLPIFFLFATQSRALADLAWDPSPGFDREDISPRMLLLIILICIIGLVWLLAKAKMLKHYDRGSGWRIIVPFHGRYLEYKNYWDEKYY